MKSAILLTACALACGCTQHQTDGHAEDQVTVCGLLRSQDGTPVSKALFHLYKLPKDTPGDVVANSYELTETDPDGRFVLRSTYADRQYWLSIVRSRDCEGLTFSELESRRIPVIFHRSTLEGDCESTINVVADKGCNLTLR